MENNEINTPYKRLKSFEERTLESSMMIKSDDSKVPVIVERMSGEKLLPWPPNRKYFVGREAQFHMFMMKVRKILQLHAEQSFFLLIAGRHMACGSTTMENIYAEHKDDDGFLYITYASQEVFG